MRSVITLVLLFCLFEIIGQSPDLIDCDGGSAIKEFESPRITCKHGPTGEIWNRDGFLLTDTQIVNEPADFLISRGGFWVGAKNANDQVHVAASTYGSSAGITDFFPGPLYESSEYDLVEICENFDRIWEVTEEDIQSFLNDWSDNGRLDNPIPDPIAEWPGRANPLARRSLGFAIPDIPLAPFVDVDADHIYNPEKGDYPAIKGAVKAQWWVFNDFRGIHTQSNGKNLGVEIHTMVYHFDQSTDDISTIFYEYQVINKSATDYTECHNALWIDSDSYCNYWDVYIGSIPSESLIYIYNNTSTHGFDGCINDLPNQPQKAFPLVGIKLLDGPVELPGRNHLTSFIYYDNQSIGNPPPGTTDPGIAIDYYHYMSGRWRDGTPLTYGGTGYNPGSTDTTKFAFSSAPDDSLGWNMCTTNFGFADRRMIMSNGPSDFPAGKASTFAFAVITTASTPDTCPSLDPLIEAGRAAEEMYDQLTDIRQLSTLATEIKLFPNPARETVFVHMEGEYSPAHIQIYNLNGQRIFHTDTVNTNAFDIDTSTFSPGMYLVMVRFENGSNMSKKLMIH